MGFIVEVFDPVTLVGAGDTAPQDVTDALRLAPVCVAVDGGVGVALAAGADPVAVIGDMDSASEQDLAHVPEARIHRIKEQNSTDFDKALRNVCAPAYVAVGFGGGRFDHQLAVMHGLAARPECACVVVVGDQIALLAPPRLKVPTDAGDLVSLFPLSHVTGRSDGLEWPIDGLEFYPTSRIGTSNRATGPMDLQINGPDMILILNKRLIQPVLEQLQRPDAVRWSPRA